MNFAWFKIDGWLFLAQTGLAVLGLTIIGSVASGLFWPQLIFVTIGLVINLVLARIDCRIYPKLTPFLYLFCLLILFLPLFLGPEIRGSFRWLKWGWFNFQPSEVVKPFLVLVFASYFSQEEPWSLKGLLVGFGLLLAPVILVFAQPDLGSSLIIIFLWLGMVLVAGITKKWIVAGSAGLFLVLPIIWHFLKDYQKERLASFGNLQADPLGAGYHLIQSQVAVGSGQLWGRGLGRGTQSHLRFLPEHQTDFIFASLAEELGFMGALVLLALFGLLLWRLLRIAERSRNQFGLLVGAGLFSWLFSQMLVNIGINLGLLPVTGITLPLVSYGGSSILAVMIGLGLGQSVADQSQRGKVIEIR